MSVLLLARQMRRGYGVAVTVAELARRLDGGDGATVGCVEADGAFGELDVRTIPPTPGAVASLARATGARAVVAHASPFHEVLPDLPAEVTRICWDHGEPPAELFPPGDRERRRRVARRKRRRVHPAADRVVTPSRFLRRELGVPDAAVVPNGCDHVEDRGPKPRAALERDGRPFRVGTLGRLGAGEARYKGGDLYRELARRLRAELEEVEVSLMGRGTAADAAPYREAGVEVRRNASDAERADYLRGLDLFVAPSLWEGFGLPAVEAQASGTAAVVFDAGAHPEVCPLVAGGPADVVELARACERDPDLLHAHSLAAHRFVRERFGWDRAAGRLEAIVDEARPRGAVAGSLAGLRRAVAPAGLRGTGYRVARRAWHLAWRILPDRLRPLRRRLADRLVRAAHRVRTEGPAAVARRALRRWLGGDR